ncbi:MAG: hypothetical protein JXM79_11040 [Sedimentisphaerales bacterium]|nr:hypothetical protein [Sedimentisphaerales bacterium]
MKNTPFPQNTNKDEAIKKALVDFYKEEEHRETGPVIIGFQRTLYIRRIRAVMNVWFASWPIEHLEKFASAVEAVGVNPESDQHSHDPVFLNPRHQRKD